MRRNLIALFLLTAAAPMAFAQDSRPPEPPAPPHRARAPSRARAATMATAPCSAIAT